MYRSTDEDDTERSDPPRPQTSPGSAPGEDSRPDLSRHGAAPIDCRTSEATQPDTVGAEGSSIPARAGEAPRPGRHPTGVRSVLGLLRDINRKLGLTVLLITHQMEVVKSICDSVAVLERGRVVEQGKVVDLIARHGTRLHELCYPPSSTQEGTTAPGGRRVELSLVGEHSTRPILTTLARRFGVDAWLLEGSMERVGETRVGRLLFELTGPPEAVNGALGFLREQGLTPEVPRV